MKLTKINLTFALYILYLLCTDDIPIQIAKAEGDAVALGAITEEKEESVSSGKAETTPEFIPRRSLPKMAVNFGKKTKEKLSIKSSNVGTSKLTSKTLVNGSGDLSETEENSELPNELTPLSMSENGSDITTPITLRKSSGSTIDLEPTRSIQVSSV